MTRTTCWIAAALAALLAACDGDPSGSGRPQLEIVAGDAQTDTVGQTLGVTLAIRAERPNGQPAPGQPVAFRVLSGGGALTVTSTATGADGRAETVWTLGTTAGTQQVEGALLDARGNIVSADTFTATAQPSQPRPLERVSPEVQTATAGSTVELAVRLRDVFGNPIPGVAIQWELGAGGGTFNPNPSTTDAQGVARTTWTLPPITGRVWAVARLAGHAPVRFNVDLSGGSVQFVVASPVYEVPVGDTLLVRARVVTPIPLASFTATVEGRSVALQNGAELAQGTIPLTGLAPGEYTLRFTATDLAGSTFTHDVLFRLNRRPVVTLVTPVEGQVVTTATMRVQATCTDDGGCGASEVRLNGTVVATGTGSIDVMVPVGSYDGQQVEVDVAATDGFWTVRDEATVFVEISSATVVAVLPGDVRDTDGQRVLYQRRTAAGRALVVVRDLATGAEYAHEVPVYWGGSGFDGRLVPGGAIVWGGTVVHVTPGGVEDIGPAVVNGYMRVDGAYAAWHSGDQGRTLYRYDASTGTRVTVSTDAFPSQADVAANGDVVFTQPDYRVYRYRAGTVQVLTPADGAEDFVPLTDGINVVYRTVGDVWRVITPGGGDEVLTTGGSVLVENGWIAFYRQVGGGWHIFTRSPTGVERQVTPSTLSTSVYPSLVALGPNGEVVYDVSFPEGRYLAEVGQAPRRIGRSTSATHPGMGRMVFAGGELYALRGSTVLRVD